MLSSIYIWCWVAHNLLCDIQHILCQNLLGKFLTLLISWYITPKYHFHFQKSCVPSNANRINILLYCWVWTAIVIDILSFTSSSLEQLCCCSCCISDCHILNSVELDISDNLSHGAFFLLSSRGSILKNSMPIASKTFEV